MSKTAAAAPKQNFTEAVGRRKEARAVVRLYPGSGRIVVNGKSMENYFVKRPVLLASVYAPFEAAGVKGRYDVVVKATGGGVSGQADAVSMGIARALLSLNSEFRKPLRVAGTLTRDPRMKERKKYGQKRARKRFQYTKR